MSIYPDCQTREENISGATTIDLLNAVVSIFAFTLTGDVAMKFSNSPDEGIITMKIIQDGTGGRSFNFGSGVLSPSAGLDFASGAGDVNAAMLQVLNGCICLTGQQKDLV